MIWFKIMRGTEYINGKAFEYALADALNKYIKPKKGLTKNSAHSFAKQAFDTYISDKQHVEFIAAANVAVRQIASLEPNFLDNLGSLENAVDECSYR